MAAISDFERDYLAHTSSAVLHGGIAAGAERGFCDQPDDVADFLMSMLGPAADRTLAP